jgi:hypothetical protein
MNTSILPASEKRMPEAVRERIEYLLANPELGREIIGDFRSLSRYSNCHGTTLWVLGIKPKAEYRPELLPDFLPAKERDRPGFMNKILMGKILHEKCEIVDNVRDALPGVVGFWAGWDNPARPRDEWAVVEHTGVYVGEGRIFHQPNTGRPFGITFLEEEIADMASFDRYHKITHIFYRLKKK